MFRKIDPNKMYQGCRYCESIEPVTPDTEAEKLSLCDSCYGYLKKEGQLADWGGKEKQTK
ncbi:hypothetical protein CN448_18785 [Bacillus cereus]|uniref:hypothetical protein n=1 Tax=Bacillus cereus TaxID=1396 RepID=UPI000BF5E284|nr:hypothetical protein [Bacillus cereus]PEW66977.1 hypothetical protein CN448_18785 [Bacillus cereus]